MIRPSVCGSWSLPMSATAPRDRSAPRWRARRTSDSRLTASPAISSSMRSPRSRDSVSVRTSSRARSSAQASASSPRAASTAGASDPPTHTTSTPIGPSPPITRARLRPGISSSMNGPMTEAGPCPRARTTAASSTPSCSSVRPAAPRRSRYSSRIATGAPMTGARGLGQPGEPRAVRPAARAAPRARRARADRPAPPTTAAARSAITAPQGTSAGTTSAGTPRSPSRRGPAHHAGAAGGQRVRRRARAEQQGVGLLGPAGVDQGERRHRPRQVGGGRARAAPRRATGRAPGRRAAPGDRAARPPSWFASSPPRGWGTAPPVSSGGRPGRRGLSTGRKIGGGVWPGVTNGGCRSARMIRRCHRPDKEGPQHHAQSPPEERRRRPVEPERVDRHRRPDRPRRRRLRRQRLRPHRPAPAPAQGRLPPAAGDDRAAASRSTRRWPTRSPRR